MVTIIVFVLLTAVISTYVIMPLIQARSRKVDLGRESSNHRAIDLIERKESIYSAIKEIEFDHEMGKISEDDFKELRQQYKQEAVDLLKKIDTFQKRKTRPTKQKGKKKSGIQAMNYCWMCGTAISNDDKFCLNCGNKLE